MICPVSNLDCEVPEYFIDREYTFGIPALPLLQDQPEYYEFTTVQKPIQLHVFVMALFASLVAPFGGFFASVSSFARLSWLLHHGCVVAPKTSPLSLVMWMSKY